MNFGGGGVILMKADLNDEPLQKIVPPRRFRFLVRTMPVQWLCNCNAGTGDAQ